MGLLPLDFPASWLVSNVRPVLKDAAPELVAAAAVALLGGDGQEHAEAAIEAVMAGPPVGREGAGRGPGRAPRRRWSST